MKLAIVLISAAIAFAAKTITTNIPVTTYVADLDASSVAYSVQSDGAAYQNGANGVLSILNANAYNHLTWGDWLLELAGSTIRTARITFDPASAVQPSDPAYTAPANPPLWGTLNEAVRMQDECTLIGKDMLTMTAGETFTCGMIITFPPNPDRTHYRLDFDHSWLYLNEPETQDVQIQCNTTDSRGCNDWFIDPVPVVNPGGGTSPGKARGRLDLVSHSNTVIANEGDFYMTFHIHVTRP